MRLRCTETDDRLLNAGAGIGGGVKPQASSCSKAKPGLTYATVEMARGEVGVQARDDLVQLRLWIRCSADS